MKYTPEEQREHRQDWIKALRSGDYKQTKGRLRRGDSFCCLGVACEISGRGVWQQRTRNGSLTYIYIFDNEALPREVANYYGIRDVYATFWIGTVDRKNNSLSNLNDKGATFDEIADIIEEEPDYLLVDVK